MTKATPSLGGDLINTRLDDIYTNQESAKQDMKVVRAAQVTSNTQVEATETNQSIIRKDIQALRDGQDVTNAKLDTLNGTQTGTKADVQVLQGSIRDVKSDQDSLRILQQSTSKDIQVLQTGVHHLQADVRVLRDHQQMNQLDKLGQAISEKLATSAAYFQVTRWIWITFITGIYAALNAWVTQKKNSISVIMAPSLTEGTVTCAIILAVVTGGVVSYLTGNTVTKMSVVGIMVAVITYVGYTANKEAIWAQIGSTKAVFWKNLHRLKENFLRFTTLVGSTYVYALAQLRAATIDHPKPMRQLAKLFAVVLGVAMIWLMIDWIIKGLYLLLLLLMVAGAIVWVETSPVQYYPQHQR